MSGKELGLETSLPIRQLTMPGFSGRTEPASPARRYSTGLREIYNGNGQGNGYEKEAVKKPFLIGRDIPVEVATGRRMNCERCNEPLLVDRVVVKRIRPKGSTYENVLVVSDLKCPNCGVRSSKKLKSGERPIEQYHKPLEKEEIPF